MENGRTKPWGALFLLVPLLLFLIVLPRCVVGGGQACESAADCPQAAPQCIGRVCMICREDTDCPAGKRCTFIGARTQCTESGSQPPTPPKEQSPDTIEQPDAPAPDTTQPDVSAPEPRFEAPGETSTDKATPDPTSQSDKGPFDAGEPAPETSQDADAGPCQSGESRDCYTGPAGTAGRGQCAPGKEACAEGQWTGKCVGAVTPTAETCDGKDNDCDGQIDDGCDCKPGETRSCYSGPANTKDVGLCQSGKQTCNKAGRWEACTGEVTPKPETCDGKDNDCDGKIDENNPGGGGSCSTTKLGECKAGKRTCSRGKLICNSLRAAKAEVCDGKDNDCDGKTDEGNPGGGASCSTKQLGECKAGSITCSSGKLSCIAKKKATTEVCDGKDNDCDGKTDEGNPGGGGSCSTSKLGECKAGTKVCFLGKLGCAAKKKPTTEVCNGKDDDCDGKIDDNIPSKTCHTHNGTYCFQGTSSCSSGKTTCKQGSSAKQCTSNANCTPCGGNSKCVVIFRALRLCTKP